MKFGIVSDIHLGDPNCSLITKEGDSYVPGEKYAEFKKKLGPNNDFLILLGDIFDFSIESYNEVFKAAQVFFTRIQNDELAKNIIYVPGNHDFDLWHTVEHQINIIHQVRTAKPARGFKWSVPGLIDLRDGSPGRGFQLPGTTGIIDPDRFEGEPLFINSITKTGPDQGQPTNFYFAYPNLYIVTDNGSFLVTHGHYLERYWTLACEWATKILDPEELGIEETLDINEVVAINFPTCQLACSGVGQAGPLTKVIRKVQRNVKDHELEGVDEYLKRLDGEIDKITTYKFGILDPREWATDLLSDLARQKIMKKLGQFRETRFSKEFIEKPEVQDRFRRYYESSLVELRGLNTRAETGIPDIPPPDKVIIGHTHWPFPWESPFDPKQNTPDAKPIKIFNTGGWLFKKSDSGDRKFCGAEIFVHDPDGGFSSRSVT